MLLLYFLIFLFVVFLDQITKCYLLANVGLGHTRQFLPGFIQFYVVQNTGGAFSFLRQYPIYFEIIGIVNVIIFSYLVFCPTVSFNVLTKLGCTCVLGGTVGNLIDRFLKGGVIDFLDFQMFSFAVFNLADVFIDIGVALILVGWFLQRKR